METALALLSSYDATFEDLKQQLWNSFETDQIYRFLTGEPDTVPEFRFNWITTPSNYLNVSFAQDSSQDTTPRTLQPLKPSTALWKKTKKTSQT